MMDEKIKELFQKEAAEEVKEAEPKQADEAQKPKEEGDAQEKAVAAANEAKEKAAQAADKLKGLPKKQKMILGGVGIVAILAIIMGLAGGSKFDRIVSDMLKQYPYANNARAADGSYLTIDTNPNDKDVDDLLYTEVDLFYKQQNDSMEGIQYVNKELGFSDAVWQKMLQTTSLMGRQTEENEKYRVSWSYHPDSGLEVMYEKK